jgi:hypothetical protein
MSTAIIESEAIHPLYRLVVGGLYYREQLQDAERCIRTIVLHDSSITVTSPFAYHSPYPEDLDYISKEDYAAQLIKELKQKHFLDRAVEEDLSLFEDYTSHPGLSNSHFGDELAALAQLTSNTKSKDNPYFNAHCDYFIRVITTITQGGSGLLVSDLAENIIGTLEKIPPDLFQHLDEQWHGFASQAASDHLGFLVPPVLGIVLTRCTRRDDIPSVIRDLRDEWAVPRRKVWKFLAEMRNAKTIGQALELRRELTEASKLFAPGVSEFSSRPIRVLWDMAASAVAGAGIAALSGVKPFIGAVTGTITSAARSTPSLLQDFGPALFGRGAFDLARRVQRETSKVEFDSLVRFLSDEEREDLGVG